MTNTLFVLAAIAATTCAQMGGETPINPSMLVQRDGCFWDCQDILVEITYETTQTGQKDTVCWDTCTPKLSEYREYALEGGKSISKIYNPYYWNESFERHVFNYALENEEQRTFDFLADFHNGDLFNGQCWPWWRCDWRECNEEEYDGSGDECWTEYCYEDCGNEEPICKFWYAREYDYEWNQWRWDIEDCDQGFVGELSGAADFVEDNFGGSIGMIAQAASERCPNGDCVDQSAMMAANVVSNVAEDVDISYVAGTVAGVLDMFYENDSAVEIANEVSHEGQDTFDLHVDELDFVINAQNSTNVAEAVSQTASYVFEEETEDVLEDNEAWADWIGTFVSGLMNRADERKGERMYDDDGHYWYEESPADFNGNW